MPENTPSAPLMWCAEGPVTALNLQDYERRVWHLDAEQVTTLLHLVRLAADGITIAARSRGLLEDIERSEVHGA